MGYAAGLEKVVDILVWMFGVDGVWNKLGCYVDESAGVLDWEAGADGLITTLGCVFGIDGIGAIEGGDACFE